MSSSTRSPTSGTPRWLKTSSWLRKAVELTGDRGRSRGSWAKAIRKALRHSPDEVGRREERRPHVVPLEQRQLLVGALLGDEEALEQRERLRGEGRR